MVSCCVLLAEGFEEIEAVAVVDVLRRAGVEVTALGITSIHPQGAHGIEWQADGLLADHAGQDWDLVVLPGGMPGSANLRDDPRVQALVARQSDAGKGLAAICAAPIALARAGVLDGRRATSYPGFGEQLSGSQYCEDRVCVDGQLITSRGPGTALEFALALVTQLVDQDCADELARELLVRVESLA